jgi:hypothetical protein
MAMKNEEYVLVAYPIFGTVPIQMTVAEYKQFLDDKANGLIDAE